MLLVIGYSFLNFLIMWILGMKDDWMLFWRVELYFNYNLVVLIEFKSKVIFYFLWIKSLVFFILYVLFKCIRVCCFYYGDGVFKEFVGWLLVVWKYYF